MGNPVRAPRSIGTKKKSRRLNKPAPGEKGIKKLALEVIGLLVFLFGVFLLWITLGA